MSNTQIIEMATVDITPYAKNAKKHPTKQIEQIAASIREFGFNQPVVVDKNNVIIVGHGRFAAALYLGMDKVPVLQLNLSESQAKAYRLADNKLNESDWDMDLVLEELKQLDTELLELTTFSLSELEKSVVRDVDVDITDDKLETYLNNNIKQIVLYLSSEQYTETINKLEYLAQEFSTDNNTDTILALIKFYEDLSKR